ALAKQGLSIMLIPATAVPLLAWFYRHELYQFLYPSLYSAYGALIFASVLTAFVPLSMGYIFGTLLTAHGSLKRLNIISTAGLVANFGLNLILIPQYKALGACIATIVTQSLVIVLTVYYCRQLFGFQINLKFFISVLIFCAASAGVFIVLTLVDINWKLELLFAILLMPVLAFVSGLVKVGDLRASFTSREV
ncbi:MAG TPA: polysaccharide biosynthesis C-terminal domain-containing protein, partial [Bacteroidia bacterium]|nr:polysaccharide biosynthesis C-terminal domain-containing protein [Bacteroidia bacterium]